MIVTLDGQRLTDSFPAEGTLQALIDQVRDAHLKNRLVVSVAVDGHPLGDTELNASLQRPLAVTAQVDVESSEPAALATAALRDLAAEFADAGTRLAGIAERLNSADVAAAIRDVGAFVSLWQTCYRALPQCGGLLDRDLLMMDYDGRPLKAYLTELVDKLTDVRAALEARDLVMLGDLVRYELPPLTQTWHAILNHLADQTEPHP
jgi:hypothetical protein